MHSFETEIDAKACNVSYMNFSDCSIQQKVVLHFLALIYFSLSNTNPNAALVPFTLPWGSNIDGKKKKVPWVKHPRVIV